VAGTRAVGRELAESPSLLGTAIAMLKDICITSGDIAEHGAVPAGLVRGIVESAADLRPRIDLARPAPGRSAYPTSSTR